MVINLYAIAQNKQLTCSVMFSTSGYITLFVWLFYAHMNLRPRNMSKTLGGEQNVFIMEKQAT